LLNEGRAVDQVLQSLDVSQATHHRWRQQYGGMKASEATQGVGAGEHAAQEVAG